MRQELHYFVIRDKTTDLYLPPGRGWEGRGYTHAIPSDPSVCLPRMFHSQLDAERALRCWLRGVYESERDDGNSYWTGKITPQPDRIPENMEIVRMVITLNP